MDATNRIKKPPPTPNHFIQYPCKQLIFQSSKIWNRLGKSVHRNVVTESKTTHDPLVELTNSSFIKMKLHNCFFFFFKILVDHVIVLIAFFTTVKGQYRNWGTIFQGQVSLNCIIIIIQLMFLTSESCFLFTTAVPGPTWINWK